MARCVCWNDNARSIGVMSSRSAFDEDRKDSPPFPPCPAGGRQILAPRGRPAPLECGSRRRPASLRNTPRGAQAGIRARAARTSGNPQTRAARGAAGSGPWRRESPGTQDNDARQFGTEASTRCTRVTRRAQNVVVILNNYSRTHRHGQSSERSCGPWADA